MGEVLFSMRTLLRSVVLVPRNVLISFLLAYRAVISPLYGQVCRYHPSCSLYALRAVQYHGALWGIGLGFVRVLRCNPFARGGIDDVPHRLRDAYEVTRLGFVKPKEG